VKNALQRSIVMVVCSAALAARPAMIPDLIADIVLTMLAATIRANDLALGKVAAKQCMVCA
jgi:hypothetical protein